MRRSRRWSSLARPQLEGPALRRPSPKTGNIRGSRRRLSANSPRNLLNREPGDRPPYYKSPPLAGIFATIGYGLSDSHTNWLRRKDSNHQMVNWHLQRIIAVLVGKSFSATTSRGGLFPFNSKFLCVKEGHRFEGKPG